MGYVFEIVDNTVWQPSNHVALCFLAQVRFLESSLEVPSGLDEVMSATIDVDCAQRHRFLVHLSEQENLRNKSLSFLLMGVVVHMLALCSLDVRNRAHLSTIYPGDWLNAANELRETAMDQPQRVDHAGPTGE